MRTPGNSSRCSERYTTRSQRDRLPDEHRRQRVVLALADPAPDLLRRQADDRAETAQLVARRRPRLRQVGGPDLDGGAGRVRDDDTAVAVEDRAALCLQREPPELVVLGRRAVGGPGQHLQRPQAEEEHGEERQCNCAEQRRPRAEPRPAARRLLRRRRVGRRPLDGRPLACRRASQAPAPAARARRTRAAGTAGARARRRAASESG